MNFLSRSLLFFLVAVKSSYAQFWSDLMGDEEFNGMLFNYLEEPEPDLLGVFLKNILS